jgi:Protein of unknown function (DUF1559)
MTDLGQFIPDDDLPFAPARSCEVPVEVQTRLRKRFVEFRGRIVARPHGRWRVISFPTAHPLRWAAAIVGSAAAVIVLVVWLSARSDAWAQVVKQMQSIPWIHAKGQFHGEPGEYWVSVPQGIWAGRLGKPDFVTFVSRETKIKQQYSTADGNLVRLPIAPHDEESLRQIDALFARAFKGAAAADLSTSIERLVKQDIREVEVDGKRWLDFELTFHAVDGNSERVTIYRVDPDTRLPKSCIEKPQFVDEPQSRVEFDYPRSGPADVFALGVPRDAKVVDHVPGPELQQILAGMKAGREKMDAYSGLIVEGSTLSHWSDSALVYRVWRSGNKWRIEQSGGDVPGFARRAMLGKDVPPRPPVNADQQAWWKSAAETIRFYPILVSDGKTSYRFKIKAVPERIASREDWEKQRYEIESVAPDYISTPTANVGPTVNLLPEFVARPSLGIPSADRQATLDPAPVKGPKGTILVSVSGERVWVDPRRGYLAIRYELEYGLNDRGNPKRNVWVVDEAAQTPSGVWYPRVVRSLASSDQIGEEIGDQPAGITRYYLDFKSPILSEAFATPVVKQSDNRGVSTPKPRTLAQVRQRALSMNRLRVIGSAMNSYNDEHHHFPSARIVGPDGKTPHSWRVALLPYLGLKELYDRYNLAEPWDSPNNSKVLAEMPTVYRALPDSKDTNAAYFLLTGEATMFPAGKTLRIRDISDGAANTLLAVEAKRDIPWTKPEDLGYDAAKPLPELGGFDPEGFSAVFVDTSARFIERSKFDDATIRAWITPAGREKVKRPD